MNSAAPLSDGPTATRPTRRGARWRWLLFAALCLTPIFFSLGNHPIHGDSEARYGVIARAMAEGDSSWLVPTYFDQPHLTKPPLTYWLMACSMRLLGDGEWPLRLPAALAGTLTLAVVFGFAQRRYGRDAAVVATAALSVTPMFVVLSRLATTDSFLGLLCTTALAAGVLAVRERRRRWAVLLWTATALAFLTKGPAGLLPIAAIFLWLLWARPARGWRSLQPWFGLPAAFVPLAVWAGLIAWQNPEAWAVWRYETFDRAVGTGDHPEPWWFFGPVALVGLLPGTALLLVWAHRKIWSRRTSIEPTSPTPPPAASTGSQTVNSDHLQKDTALWWIMITTTLLVFTLITGKLMSYLIPLAAPAALLLTYAICCNKGFYKLNSQYIFYKWAWCAALIALAGLALAEDHATAKNPPDALVAEIYQQTGLAEPQVLTVGFIDRRLPYYTRRPTDRIDPRVLAHVWDEMRKDDLVLVADPDIWGKFASDPNWDLTRRFVRLDFDVQLGRDDKALCVYRTRPELR